MAALVSLKSGACQPGTQTGEFMVTVPVGLATSRIPDRVSRPERINTWVAAVLSWRGEVVVVERAERGAYREYGTLPANSRRSPRAGPRSSMCSSGGASVRGPFKAGANEVAGGEAVLIGVRAGFAVGTTESAGGRGTDTRAGATTG